MARHQDPGSPSVDDADGAGTEHAWCEQCSRLLTHGEVRTSLDGEPICRTCGEPVEFERDEEGPVKAPWHFKVLLLGTIGYLIYRAIWFVQWIGRH